VVENVAVAAESAEVVATVSVVVQERIKMPRY
jgi:hypothetical protein